jgi:hypothetical protein
MNKQLPLYVATALTSGLALAVPHPDSATSVEPSTADPPTTVEPALSAYAAAPSGAQSAAQTGAQSGPGPSVTPAISDLDLPVTQAGREARIPARNTRRFSVVGVTWPYRRHSEQIVAKIRVRRDGVWTPWQRLHIQDDEGPDPADARRGRSGTDPLWVGAADGVEASLTTGDGTALHGGKVALIDPGTRPQDNPEQLAATADTTTTASTTASPAPYARPPIIPRRSWGADESLRSYNGAACARPRYTSTIRAAFVHHTAGSNSYSSSQSAALVRGIYAYHVKSRGWCDIGYNFLVDKYGRAFEGRYGGMHLPVLGAHTGNFNSNSFGISMMGNFETVVPSSAMMEKTSRVIAWKLDMNYRSPWGKVSMNGVTLNAISGHRDTKSTACPGKYVYYRLGTIRSRVSQLMGYAVSTEIYQFSRQLGGEAAIGPPFWGEHPVPNSGRGTWFTRRDLYWSSATGANSVYGTFRIRHRQLGASSGPLGLPKSEQQNGKLPGSRVQEFYNGGTRAAMYWSSATGAQGTYGAIMARYVGLGAELSRLRLPVTTPYRISGGLAQEFQGGWIRWYSSTGRTYVTYK